MAIDIIIDSLTNCLVRTETGEECDTEYRLVARIITKQDAAELKAQGWKFDWSIPHQNGYEVYCQTAHCGRCKPHFDFGVIASPIVPYRNLPQAPDGMTADCRSLVSKAAGAAFEIRP